MRNNFYLTRRTEKPTSTKITNGQTSITLRRQSKPDSDINYSVKPNQSEFSWNQHESQITKFEKPFANGTNPAVCIRYSRKFRPLD